MVFFFVFLGGGVGSLTRYLLSLWVGSLWDGTFPLGTFLINIIGCFFIGFLGGFSERTPVDPQVRLLLQTGFLGGFTTFSSFGLETMQLVRKGAHPEAFAYVIGSNLVGIAMVFAGYFAAKGLLGSSPKDR